jgi:sugar/nucleoside kinase (ribokinase family)
MDQIDFFAIGDMVVDDFIRLQDAHVTCKINEVECEICMRWGDKIPFESSTYVPGVGNSANAAVAAARLGLTSALRAYVGEDVHGQECISELVRNKVDITYVEKQKGKHTNYHYVLWFGDNRTILVKHEKYDYALPSLSAGPAWIYLSSLGESSLNYQHTWMDKLKDHQNLMGKLEHWDSKLVFQPGTFHFKLGYEALKDVYKRTDLFFCNKEEAERILDIPAGADIKDLLQKIQALGPKIAVITDDRRGSYAIDEAGAMVHCPRYPDPRAPFEITGAGDALASTTVAALALGKPLGEALRWGSANASAVLQEIGAQKGLLDRATLEQHVANPPAEWIITTL